MSLEAREISFSYGSRQILSDISFRVNRGEVLCLLGPNGTGKTTLLKCINRILTPSSGSSYVDEMPIHRMKTRQRAENIGYVPQSTASPFPISVADAVMMGRLPFVRHKIRDEDKQIVFDTIRLLGLEEFTFQNLNEMSGGERQRVFIARALVQEPKVLLLDEPTSALDMKNQLFTLQLVRELAAVKNLAVLMTIHDLNLAAMFADRVIMLKDAAIHACGACRAVITEDNIRQVYGVNTEVAIRDGAPHVRLKKGLPERA